MVLQAQMSRVGVGQMPSLPTWFLEALWNAALYPRDKHVLSTQLHGSFVCPAAVDSLSAVPLARFRVRGRSLAESKPRCSVSQRRRQYERTGDVGK